MNYPDEVLDAVKWAVDRHQPVLEKQLEAAERKVRGLPTFPEFESALVTMAIRDAVYAERHRRNTKLKNEQGAYGRPAKVVCGDSPEVNRASSGFGLYIAGTVLGRLKGAELPAVAEHEESIGRGHMFNARVLRLLIRHVPKDKTVEEAVSARKLEGIFRRAGRDSDEDAALRRIQGCNRDR